MAASLTGESLLLKEAAAPEVLRASGTAKTFTLKNAAIKEDDAGKVRYNS